MKQNRYYVDYNSYAGMYVIRDSYTYDNIVIGYASSESISMHATCNELNTDDTVLWRTKPKPMSWPVKFAAFIIFIILLVISVSKAKAQEDIDFARTVLQVTSGVSVNGNYQIGIEVGDWKPSKEYAFTLTGERVQYLGNKSEWSQLPVYMGGVKYHRLIMVGKEDQHAFGMHLAAKWVWYSEVERNFVQWQEIAGEFGMGHTHKLTDRMYLYTSATARYFSTNQIDFIGSIGISFIFNRSEPLFK